MKVIIAGSRTILKYSLVPLAVARSGFKITEVVCGGARGVDSLGMRWAIENGIPYKLFPASWAAFGKQAGFRRNTQMAEYADALIAITNGSPGTRHMIEEAQMRNRKVFILVQRGVV